MYPFLSVYDLTLDDENIRPFLSGRSSMSVFKMNIFKYLGNIFRILFFLIISLGFIGCSTVSNVKEATIKTAKNTAHHTTRIIPFVGASNDGMIRKVAVVSFDNETVLKQLSLEETLQNTIVQYFSDSCPSVQLLFPGTPGFPEPLKLIKSQPLETFDNLTIVKTGRQSGMNAIMTGRIVNVSTSREEKGILWFRKTKEKLQVQFYLEVMDMETGAKIFDARFVHEIDGLDPQQIQSFRDGQPTISTSITREIDELGQDMARKMCRAILSQPWTGFIASVENQQAFLPFGKSSGIEKGKILNTFDTGEVIENFAGQQFILPGKKIGKIRISRVEENFSTGEIISGENIRPGNSVKLSK